MKLLQETTDWDTPNHIYIFGASSLKIVGYIKAGETVAFKFAKPIQFDKRRRTFTEIKVKDHKKFDLTSVKE